MPLLAEHPFRERLWWQRMLALVRLTTEMLDRCRAALSTEEFDAGRHDDPGSMTIRAA